jgi:ubiquinone/menaquinone biosynthesis C-methylase UbiE
MGTPTPEKLSLMEGYSRWAHSYDTTFNTLIATEEVYSLDLLDSLEGTTALDAGAGTGRFALRLGRKGWKVTAIEPNSGMRAIGERAAASENLLIEFVNASLEDDVPVESATFDLVVCALTLCHVANLGGAIGEFYRTMAPGAHLLITDVHPDFVASGMPTQFVEDGVTYHLPNEPHTRDEYLQAVMRAGLTLSAVRDVPGSEVPGGFQTEFMRKNFSSVNFALIILARKER